MDDNERNYFRDQIRSLERSVFRWRTMSLVLAAVIVLFGVVGLGSVATYGLFAGRRQAMMQEVQAARDAEAYARQQAELAAAAERARAEAEKHLRQKDMPGEPMGLESKGSPRNSNP